MRLVKDDHRVSVVDLEVLSDLFIDEIVVWHENEVCGRDSVLGRVIGTILVLDCLFVNLLDVHRVPRHLSLALITILVEKAWVNTLLRSSAGCIKCEAFVHVYLRIDTEVVPASDQHRPRLKHCVQTLFLNLGKLRMRPAAVDNFWQLEGLRGLLLLVGVVHATGNER